MRKILTLFERNVPGDRLIRDEVVPGAEWVLAGEGVATRKWDGTACLIDQDGMLLKRYDAKPGRTPPEGFIAAQDEAASPGHWPGWIPVGDGPEDRFHREALRGWETEHEGNGPPPGTYELVGPKVSSSPEGGCERLTPDSPPLDHHILVAHGQEILEGVPRDFAGLRDWLIHHNIEGIVWWHPDGRMVKIKGKDFGHRRPVRRWVEGSA